MKSRLFGTLLLAREDARKTAARTRVSVAAIVGHRARVRHIGLDRRIASANDIADLLDHLEGELSRQQNMQAPVDGGLPLELR